MTAAEKGRCSFGHSLIFLVILAFLAQPARAQDCFYSECVPKATFSEHVAMVGINSLLGGISAGVLRLARGDHISDAFLDGFLRGAAGGAVSYGGKGVAAQEFWGAGLLGRQVAALGISTIANAGDGVPPFSRLVLSLGPLPGRLVISRGESGLSLQPKADLISTIAVLYGIASPEYDTDWNASLSGGIAVFREDSPLPDDATLEDIWRARARAKSIARATGGSIAGATTVGGAVFVSYLAPDARVIAHERVHTIQFDFLLGAGGDQIDTWVMRMAPGVDRWLKINLVPALFGAVNQTFFIQMDYDDLPWEREASLLSGYR